MAPISLDFHAIFMHTSDYCWQSAFRIVKAIMYSVDGRIKDTLLLGA